MESFGENHAITMTTIKALIKICDYLKDDRTEQFILKKLEIELKNHNEDEKIAETAQETANFYFSQEGYVKSEEFALLALELKLKAYGENNFKVWETKAFLQKLYHQTRELDKFEKYNIEPFFHLSFEEANQHYLNNDLSLAETSFLKLYDLIKSIGENN